MGCILTAEGCVVALVLVAVNLVVGAEHVCLNTGILCRGKAELGSTESLAVNGGEGRTGLSVLLNDVEREGVLRLGEEVVAIAGTCLDELSVGLLGCLVETVLQHLHGCIGDILCDKVRHGILDGIGHRVVLEHHFHDVILLLLVLLDGDERLGRVGHRLNEHRGRIGRHLDWREHLLNLLLSVVYIDVTDNDDCLIVGAIPLLVIIAENLMGEVVYHLHGADRQAVAVLTAGVELRQCTLEHTHVGSEAAAPLLVDDTTLLVDLRRVEDEVVCPVVEDEQTAVESRLACSGHVGDVIDGLVDGCVGIEVSAELHTDRLAIADDIVLGEVLRAVEAHVLEEVGETVLVVFLLEGSDVSSEIEFSPLCRLVVVADIIGHAVVQLSYPYCRVIGKRSLTKRRCSCKCGCDEKK